MSLIDIEISGEEVRVNKDTPTSFRISDYYLSCLEKVYTLREEEARGLGREIFLNIFSTEKRREYLKRVLEDLRDEEKIVLKVSSEREKIHNLPFELIYDDEIGFLLKQGHITLIRDIPSTYKKIIPIKNKVRILFIISLPLETYQKSPLDPLNELKIIYDALSPHIDKGMVEVDVEEKANLKAIRTRLAKGDYNIIHFTGHGIRGGRLLIEDEEDTDKERIISIEEFAQLFRYKNIRLFYFDACETAKATELEPSLAYYIYKNLPQSCVIANLMTVFDPLATEATKQIYQALFEKNNLTEVLTPVRLGLSKDWWKPVVFASEPKGHIFEIEKPKKIVKSRIKRLPEETTTHYVYRYALVREASDKIENTNYLVLHGIGGAGKSTLAQYLAEFYEGKFRHILFFDLKGENISNPDELLNHILEEIEINNLATPKEIDKIYHLDRPERIKIRRKLEFIVERLKERTLLVLDNLEGMAQDEKGILKSDWRGLIDALLSENIFFIILTSRLKPFYDERRAFDNVLEIGEYTEAEVGFLRQRLIKGKFREEAEYLDKKISEIERYFGLHPLSIAKAIELRYEDLMILIKIEEFKKYLDFYRNYFKRFEEDTKYLFSLPYSFSQAFMEKILSPDFIAYMKNRLLAFKKINGHFYPYEIIRTYFLNEFKLDLDTLKRFKDKLLTIIGTKGFTPKDALNALNIFLYYYKATKDKGIEKEIVETFNHYHPEDRVIDPSLLDALSKTLKEFKTVDSFKLAIAKQTLGELYTSVGKGEAIDSLKGAIDDYDKALEIKPDYAGAYNNRANAKQSLGKLYTSVGKREEAMDSLKEAIDDYDKALEQNPKLAGAYNNRAHAKRILGKLYTSVGKGEEAIDILKGAIDDYDKALEQNPKLAEAYNNRAIAKQTLGKLYTSVGKREEAMDSLKEAIDDYDKALEQNPKLAGAYNNRAIAKQTLGKLYTSIGKGEEAIDILKGAIDDYDKALEQNPKLAEAYNNRASAKQNLGELYASVGKGEEAIDSLKEAIDNYDKALEQNPKLAEAYNNRANAKGILGELYASIGKGEEAIDSLKGAIDDYDKALEIKPDYAEAYNNRASAKQTLGELYVSAGKRKEAIDSLKGAIDDCNEALKLNPNLAEAYNNRANAKRILGELYASIGKGEAIDILKGAIDDYDKALEIKPDFADAYNNRALAKEILGKLYASEGKGEEAIDSLKGAIDDYDKALEIKPDYAGAYNNRAIAKGILGKLYASVGKGEEAIKSFNSAYLDLKELLHIYKESQGFWGMLEIYPRLIDLGVKAKNRDYQELAEYIEDFLGLFEALAPEGRKRGIIHFFVKEKTLDNLDLSVIKAYIKTPISKKRLDEFIEMYEIVKELMEKEV